MLTLINGLTPVVDLMSYMTNRKVDLGIKGLTHKIDHYREKMELESAVKKSNEVYNNDKLVELYLDNLKLYDGQYVYIHKCMYIIDGLFTSALAACLTTGLLTYYKTIMKIDYLPVHFLILFGVFKIIDFTLGYNDSRLRSITMCKDILLKKLKRE